MPEAECAPTRIGSSGWEALQGDRMMSPGWSVAIRCWQWSPLPGARRVPAVRDRTSTSSLTSSRSRAHAHNKGTDQSWPFPRTIVPQRLSEDEFELVAVGRALLADPAWAEKVRQGRLDDLVPFTRAALETLS